MDTITHGVVGALVGKAFFAGNAKPDAPSWREPPRDTGRVAIVSATLAAMFPDIDVFAGPLAHNSTAIMTWHRNITHSLLLLPMWAALLAVLASMLARRLHWPAPPWMTLFAICAIALASHIFLDLITSFGIMIWSPLDYARPAWDWVFIVDLTLTSAALVPQLAAWAFRREDGAVRRAFLLWAISSGAILAVAAAVRTIGVPFSNTAVAADAMLFATFYVLPLRHGSGLRFGRSRWSRAGVALVAVYLAFAGGMHHVALQHVADFVTDTRLAAQATAALPLPPSAARWAGMVSTAEGVYRVEFDQIANDPVRFHFFPQAAPNRYIAAARDLRDVQIFLWFARFPLFRYFERDGQSIVQLTDLRFYGDRGSRAREISAGDAGAPASDEEDEPTFTLQVVFAADGRVLSNGFLRN
jgi:membrane-bound metal-dependent hydrolase YbcI (DUF457 family)